MSIFKQVRKIRRYADRFLRFHHSEEWKTIRREIEYIENHLTEISDQITLKAPSADAMPYPTKTLTHQPYDPHTQSYPLAAKHPYVLQNIELTNHCPMSCVMCPRAKHMNRELGFMDMELFRSTIDQFNRDNPCAFNTGTWGGTCLHHFGESLMHPKFDEAIRYAQGKGLDICISINPLALDAEKSERLFRAKPKIVYACVDGHDDASFEKIRGVANAYEKTVANTFMAMEHRDKCSPNTELLVTIIDIPIFFEEINRVCREWEKHGVRIHRKVFVQWNGAYPEINVLGEASPKIRKITCATPTPALSPCETPWKYMSMLWDGAVVACCMDHSNLYSLGDANCQSLMDIWNGKKMRALRQEIRSGFIFNDLCEVCECTRHVKH